MKLHPRLLRLKSSSSTQEIVPNPPTSPSTRLTNPPTSPPELCSEGQHQKHFHPATSSSHPAPPGTAELLLLLRERLRKISARILLQNNIVVTRATDCVSRVRRRRRMPSVTPPVVALLVVPMTHWVPQLQ